MKIRFAAVAFALSLVLIVYSILQNRADAVQIVLRSEPFPMTIGSALLKVEILGTNGKPIEDASLRIITQLNSAGAPEIVYFPNRYNDGSYEIPVVWSMMGQGSVLVSAELPNNQVIEERFSIFVYLVPPLSSNQQTSYRSFDDISQSITANSATEYWIVIPQGTREMMLMGMGDEFVPAQIRLNLKGQNTLVIRNDDFADHT